MSKWYEKGVFYHMYPLGMTGAPKHNDGTGVTDRFAALNRWIPHIKSLGCNAVYIGPLFESTSHGYDTRDYKLVDRRLGGNDSFEEFVKLCHREGIKVVADGVFNHTGREFFAFKDIQDKRENSPFRDWYKGVNFGWESPLSDPFGYEAWQGHFELPCLNLFNQDVKNYLLDVIQFWIDTFDIDGLRLDCANVLDFNFMKEMRSRTASMKEDFWLMGEVIHGDYSRWVNDEMLHSVTNYELHKSIYSGHNDHNYFEIAHNVRRLEALGGKLYTFVDNHDEDRIASKLADREHLFSVWLLLLTLPGIPSVYYGSEWAVEGKRSRTSDEVLRPRIDIADEVNLHCELTDFISQLGRVHDENEEFHGGAYKELLLTNRQYAFARLLEKSAVIIAVNNDSNETSVNISVPFCAKEGLDLLTGTVIPVENQQIKIKLQGNRGTAVKIVEG